jgi:hypothetical protein
VIHFNSFDLYAVNFYCFAPGKLAHPSEAADKVSVTLLHDRMRLPREPLEGAKIAVIHMSVRQENAVKQRKFFDRKRRFD